MKQSSPRDDSQAQLSTHTQPRLMHVLIETFSSQGWPQGPRNLSVLSTSIFIILLIFNWLTRPESNSELNKYYHIKMEITKLSLEEGNTFESEFVYIVREQYISRWLHAVPHPTNQPTSVAILWWPSTGPILLVQCSHTHSLPSFPRTVHKKECCISQRDRKAQTQTNWDERKNKINVCMHWNGGHPGAHRAHFHSLFVCSGYSLIIKLFNTASFMVMNLKIFWIKEPEKVWQITRNLYLRHLRVQIESVWQLRKESPKWKHSPTIQTTYLWMDSICSFVCLFDKLRYSKVNNHSLLGWFRRLGQSTTTKMFQVCIKEVQGLTRKSWMDQFTTPMNIGEASICCCNTWPKQSGHKRLHTTDSPKGSKILTSSMLFWFAQITDIFHVHRCWRLGLCWVRFGRLFHITASKQLLTPCMHAFWWRWWQQAQQLCVKVCWPPHQTHKIVEQIGVFCSQHLWPRRDVCVCGHSTSTRMMRKVNNNAQNPLDISRHTGFW